MTTTDIFIVDDERLVGQTLGIILRQAGYRVEVFDDPHAVLLCMSHAPRLLLTDQDMPGLSGCSLASLFALAMPGIAILLFSAALSEMNLEWQMLQRQRVQSRLLHKPMHPTQMLAAVRESIGEPGTNLMCAAKMARAPRFPSAYPLERVMQTSTNAAMMVV